MNAARWRLFTALTTSPIMGIRKTRIAVTCPLKPMGRRSSGKSRCRLVPWSVSFCMPPAVGSLTRTPSEERFPCPPCGGVFRAFPRFYGLLAGANLYHKPSLGRKISLPSEICSWRASKPAIFWYFSLRIANLRAYA